MGWQKSISRVRLGLIKILVALKLSRAIHYIGSTEVLPPPLGERQEMDLITRLGQGEMTVKSTLIEHNLRLVVYIAKKFENTGINIEDLVSIGTIGLIKAVNTFEPSKNIKLATYASRCIENEILMYLRRNLKNQDRISPIIIYRFE
jgi:RNA polymerase sporulation-specific sigma factor